MKTAIIILLLAVALGASLYAFLRRAEEWPTGKPCSGCGVESAYGYDKEAEDFANIKPMCLKCLLSHLESDYSAFRGRAVIIEPADGPPSYVFQPLAEWRAHFRDSKIADDVDQLLETMEPDCHDCGQKARFVWVESRGLNGDNFTKTLGDGISMTLLPFNPKPMSLCAKCCLEHIAEALKVKHISYGEVCSPKGSVDGFVVPMGY